ncbi:hypothetical protein N9408_05845, partial [Opitutales bacterium]|nr:hypothetical protein [Opitutales bacterium]
STGSVTDLGDINIDGTLSVSAVGQNIDLSGGGSNDITGAVTLTGAAVTLGDSTATSIAAITATGALSVTSGGAITQTGAIDADSTASFTAGGNAITLANAGNDFSGAVSLSNSGSNNVSLTDTNALDLGTVGIGQNLTLTTGGALTDSGAITVSGLATIISSGQAVTLGDSTTANFGSIDFTGGIVSITEASAMQVAASEATGSLTLVSSGAITQSGAIDADSTASFTAGGNSITLTNAGNDFSGAVSLSNSGSNDVSLADSNALDLGTVVVGQNLTLTSGEALTDSGVLNVAGNVGITTSANNGGVSLDQASDIDGTLSITTNGSGATSVTNLTGSIELGTITTAGLTIDARGITQSGVSTVSGASSFSASANVITLDQANEFSGAVSLSNSGANNVIIDDANDLVLGTVTIATGNLNVDNAGTITQTGTGIVNVGGNTVLDNSDGDNADITLANANNAFTGTVTITTDTGSDISIADTTAFDLGALTVNSLTVSAGGDISDSGVLDIATAASFATTAVNGNVVLNQASDIDGALSLSTHGTGTASVINLTDAIELGAVTSAALTVEADGAITQSNAATISGDSSFTNTDGDNAAISLNNESNSFGGSIALATDSGSAVTLTDTTAIELPALTVATLTVTSGGAVTDSSTLTVTGATSISASGQNITLDEELSTFGAISLVGADVAVTENGDIDLGTSTITGSASFNSSGNAISDSGTLTITGATTLNSGTGNITLNDTSSTLGDLTVTGGEVYLQDTGAITATINQASKVQLKAGTGVSTSSTGVAKFAAESDSGDISITNTGGYEISDFASDSGITGVRFTDSDATGTITLIANSPLTINAPVDAGKGALQLTAVGSASTDNVTVNEAISGGAIAIDAGNSIAVNSGGVTSSSLSLTANNDISVNTPIIVTSANLNAGDQISLESGASVSASTFNVTSTKLKVDPSASVPAFNFSGGAEGDPSFDRNGRVQEATQNDWNSYFRASGTVELAYDSAGDVVLDQMILSFIENEAAPVNSGEVELEEEE